METSRLDRTIFKTERIRGLSVVVAGAGALGNEVVKALALLGVRRIQIVDPDVVERANLTCSIFFRQSDFQGTNKAEALAAAATRIFPETAFLASPCEIADTSAACEAADLIFSCVDNELARLEIAYLSTWLGVPVADGGLGGHDYSHGRVSWFPGRQGACYGCLLSGRRRRELLTSWQADSFSCAAAPAAEIVPSTPMMSAIIGSLQVESGLRYLLSATPHSESVELSLGDAPRLQIVRNVQSVECPFHHYFDEVRVPRAGNRTADEVLAGFHNGGNQNAWVHLDWPVCTQARCQVCGHGWAPMLRVGWLRRHARCPACASGDVLILKNIQSLKRGGAFAAHPLWEFGVPPHAPVSVRAR